MHYLFMIPIVLGIVFATGGHSQMFGDAYAAAVEGHVNEAASLFASAVRNTIRAADQDRAQPR